MPTCSAVNCSYKHKNKTSGRTVHRFPLSRPNILEKWLSNMKREGWYPNKRSLLCSGHFEENCFEKGPHLTKLRKDAIPTKFNLTPRLLQLDSRRRGEKKFKCDLCPYSSFSQKILDTHTLVHTDQKLFRCDECNQTFRQKGAANLLRRHKNLYHNPEKPPPKEKTHECSECKKTFLRKDNLTKHLAIHNPDASEAEKEEALKIDEPKSPGDQTNGEEGEVGDEGNQDADQEAEQETVENGQQLYVQAYGDITGLLRHLEDVEKSEKSKKQGKPAKRAVKAEPATPVSKRPARKRPWSLRIGKPKSPEEQQPNGEEEEEDVDQASEDGRRQKSPKRCSSEYSIPNLNSEKKIQDYAQKLFKARAENVALRKRLKGKQQEIRRLRKRLITLNELVDDLKKKSFITDNASKVLKKNFKGLPLDLALRMLKGKKGKKTRETYPLSLRCFAITLQHYSHRAYNYVRSIFGYALPHPSMLRSWSSSIDDGEHGMAMFLCQMHEYLGQAPKLPKSPKSSKDKEEEEVVIENNSAEVFSQALISAEPREPTTITVIAADNPEGTTITIL